MISCSSFMIPYSVHYFVSPKLFFFLMSGLSLVAVIISILLGVLNPSTVSHTYVLHKGCDFFHSEMLL